MSRRIYIHTDLTERLMRDALRRTAFAQQVGLAGVPDRWAHVSSGLARHGAQIVNSIDEAEFVVSIDHESSAHFWNKQQRRLHFNGTIAAKGRSSSELTESFIESLAKFILEENRQ